jgi:hypothetical protein
MSYQPVLKRTAYADLVQTWIENYYSGGGGAFCVSELANYAGITATHNLRRQLAHMVSIGFLRTYLGKNKKQRLVNVYFLSEEAAALIDSKHPF